MATNVRELVNALKTVTAGYLTDFQELDHVYEVEKNHAIESKSGWGVIAEDISLVSGETNHNTYDQTFQVLLTDYYVTSVDGDLCKQDAVIALLDKSHCLYDEFVRTKLYLKHIIIIINDMNVSIEELDDHKSVIVRLTFNIKYRNMVKRI